MTLSQRIEIIKQFQVFNMLDQEAIKVIAQNAKEISFPEQTQIITPISQSTYIYLAYQGLIASYINTAEGKIIPIKVLQAPYIASEVNIVDEETEVTLETLQKTHTLALLKADCRKFIMNNPEARAEILRIVIKKLHVVSQQVEKYYSMPLKARTKNLLRELAHIYPANTIPLSHEEIANLVGASRARITEVLNELREEKVIALNYRVITVL